MAGSKTLISRKSNLIIFKIRSCSVLRPLKGEFFTLAVALSHGWRTNLILGDSSVILWTSLILLIAKCKEAGVFENSPASFFTCLVNHALFGLLGLFFVAFDFRTARLLSNTPTATIAFLVCHLHHLLSVF